jgi:RNA polymerase sigma-70 factor (ECF subfamily)
VPESLTPEAQSKTPSTASDEDLMSAYIAGDAAAFRELFARYATGLARAIRAHVAADDEVRDVVQQTFLQLHRSRRDYHPGDPLRPWLYTIAFNLCRDRWRQHGRRHEIDLEAAPELAATGTPADALEAKRRSERLRAALAQLSDDQRWVVEMHWFGEIPLSEVATSLGISLSAAKVRAHRAYQRLREILVSSGGL